MKVIGDLALVQEWKMQQVHNGSLSVPHLVNKTRDLERRLEVGLMDLREALQRDGRSVLNIITRVFVPAPWSTSTQLFLEPTQPFRKSGKQYRSYWKHSRLWKTDKCFGAWYGRFVSPVVSPSQTNTQLSKGW